MFMFKRCNCISKVSGCCWSDKDVTNLSSDLTIIAVKSRLELLFLLKSKSHCVCDLITHTNMSQSLISHHLADLMKSKLVYSKREGKFIEYFLTKKGEKVVQALDSIIS